VKLSSNYNSKFKKKTFSLPVYKTFGLNGYIPEDGFESDINEKNRLIKISKKELYKCDLIVFKI
jgi:hypothetical protein